MESLALERLHRLERKPRGPAEKSRKTAAGSVRSGSSCERQRIALIAHDAKKEALLDWAHAHAASLQNQRLVATEGTGELLRAELGLDVSLVQSGPLGGDQEVGAMVARGELDMLIFFIDPLASHPHEPDIQGLIRVAILNNLPMALSLASAEMFASELALRRQEEILTGLSLAI